MRILSLKLTTSAPFYTSKVCSTLTSKQFNMHTPSEIAYDIVEIITPGNKILLRETSK